MTDNIIRTSIQAVFVICLIGMLWLYSKGYENSIGWEVTTSAEVVKYPGIKVEGKLLDFQVTGEKYLLTESYTGGPIIRNFWVDSILVSIGWLGLCVVMVSSSFLKRYGFLFSLALFTLLINRLNLGEVGLFGIQTRMALLIPFLSIVGSLFYFHEYRPKTNFLIRLCTLILISALIVIFGVKESAIFLDHFASHSLFSFSIGGLIFLLILAEENIFGILLLVTKGKGGKSNHLHFIFLSSIYLLNLILYYLNKAGIIPNSFSFFDPFILLAISCIISFWTLKHKANFLSRYLSREIFHFIFFGLGILLFSVLGLSFFRGNDAVYESFHYFILYFHIGFGVFFFLYIIINFIDALIQGFEIYKIAYEEQHFPYISARLGGFFAVLGFFFLSVQASYNLLNSGYNVNLGNLEETYGNSDLANQYYRYASFLGTNTHHSNYQLAWNYSDKGNRYLTKVHFEKATYRFPSPYTYINYANLDQEINPVKVQATLERASEKFDYGEISNNQGVLQIGNEEWDRALGYFSNAESGDTWNQAPLLNKWATYKKMESIDSTNVLQDYEMGNYGIKTNILLSVNEDSILSFENNDLVDAPVLHRQAYLLSSAPVFSDDTLAALAIRELGQSTNGNYNDRLRKALAIHYYRNGNVNKAFQMLDYLQANSYQHQKGGYLNDLGKLALDQRAYKLALDFFGQAISNDNFSAEINQLEALAHLARKDEIPGALLEIVKKDAGLTTMANQILENLSTAAFHKKEFKVSNQNLNLLEDGILIKKASENAFDETLVIEIVEILNIRNNPEAYIIILEATEINPYAVSLMKMFAFTALNQNLVRYAEEMLPRIKALSSHASYLEFVAEFNTRKEGIDSEEW